MSPGEVFANDDVMRQKLREPFPPELIGQIPKGGQKLDFVGHAAVTDRLLQEAPDFTYRIDHMETQDGHLLGILATMTIGGKSVQEAGAVDRKTTWGEELKLAISDFLRRGAMRFGVALDLWSKEDLQAVPASNNGANDWDAIEAKVSGGSTDGEAVGSPENVTVGDGNPSSLGSSPAVASTELWAEAIALDLTKARVLSALRQAGADVSSASEVTTEQLESILSPLRKVAKR